MGGGVGGWVERCGWRDVFGCRDGWVGCSLVRAFRWRDVVGWWVCGWRDVVGGM